MQVPILLLWNFVGNKLVARMALLDKGSRTYFPNSNDYILLWKLEVLERLTKDVDMLSNY